MKKLKLGKMFRSHLVRQEEINQDERTVSLSFSSEDPFERWFGVEILDHSAGAVRLDRMKLGAAVLVDHNTKDHVGVVEKVALANRRGTAVVRFGKSARAEEIYQDVLDGIRKFVSVGYWVHKMVLEEQGDDGPDVYRVTDWEPLEVSIVAVPADATVGIGREAGDDAREITVEEPKRKEKEAMNYCPHCGKLVSECKGDCEGGRAVKAATTMPTPTLERSAEQRPDIHVVESKAAERERQRARAIREIGEKNDMRELAERAVDDGTSIDDFRKIFIDELGKRAKPYNPDAPKRELGMASSDARDFSFFRLVNWMADRGDSGARKAADREIDICDAWAKKAGLTGKGMFVPPDVLYKSPYFQRAPITNATEGADLKPTIHDAANFIDVLRASTGLMQMVTILPGLTGDVLIPRQSAGSSAVFTAAETTALTESVATFDQVLLQPKRLGAWTEFSRRANILFNPSLENLIRNDLLEAISNKIVAVIINGKTASNEPNGILNTSGIGSVTVGNVAVDWTSVVNLEREVDTDNALLGSLGYLTNPLVKAQMKREEVAASTGQFIWDRSTPTAPVNGYPCAITTLVPSNLGVGTNRSALIFGNFADCLVGIWDTVELIVNPYTGDTTDTIRLTVRHEVDIKLRHAESFSAAVDIDHAAA